MLIGVLRVEYRLHGVFSRKEKRNIANSIKQKIRNKFNVSVAEVDKQDSLGSLVLGIITVSNDGKKINKVLQKCAAMLESISSEEIWDISMEIIGV